MRFFYKLSRFSGGEYVVVRLEYEDSYGVGAVIPDRSKGQNYKTVMGAVEEYRYVVETSRPEHFPFLSSRLEKHFPGHPEVRFAISCAATELFARLSNLTVSELLMVSDLEDPPESECEDPVVPEELGGVVETLSLPLKDCLLIRSYPNGEMSEILRALGRYFKRVMRR